MRRVLKRTKPKASTTGYKKQPPPPSCVKLTADMDCQPTVKPTTPHTKKRPEVESLGWACAVVTCMDLLTWPWIFLGRKACDRVESPCYGDLDWGARKRGKNRLFFFFHPGSCLWPTGEVTCCDGTPLAKNTWDLVQFWSIEQWQLTKQWGSCTCTHHLYCKSVP